MKNKTRGKVLVINNEAFERLPSREGTLADRRGIETVFFKLGFDVDVHCNKKCQVGFPFSLCPVAREYYSKLFY